MLPDIPPDELNLLKQASAMLSNAEERLLLLAEVMTAQAMALREAVLASDVPEDDAREELVVWQAGLAESDEARDFEAARVQSIHAAQVVAEALSREQGDLLSQVKQRKKWPGAAQRYCTSDHKRAPTHRVYTKLVREMRSKWIAEGAPLRPVRVLEVLGIRAKESPKRASLSSIETNEAASNQTMRHVTAWLPLHDWTDEEVWARIRHSGVPYHEAYDLGMPRLSCAFCVLSSRDALMIAGTHNPDLLEEYVTIEKDIGHDFQHKKPIREIKEALARGEKPKYARTDWSD